MAIDLILLAFAIAGFWVGYTKGIVATLFSVMGYIVAMLITIIFSPWLSGLFIRQFQMNRMLALVLGTLIFFVISIFLIKWIGKKTSAYLKKSKSDRFTKILGGIVMMLVNIGFYSVLLWLVNHLGLLSEKIKLSSISYETLEAIHTKAGILAGELKPIFHRYWDLMQESIQRRTSDTPVQ